jgi:3-oxoadipate enol-lactonase
MPYVDIGQVSLFFGEAGSGGIPVLLLHELGGSSESWREVVPLLAPDHRAIAVDFRCAGRSEKPVGSFKLSDLADDIEALLQLLGIADAVDVIGAGRRTLSHSPHGARAPPHDVRRRPAMAGSTRAYVAERAEKVRVVGMRGVADASLANSFPASHPEQRAAYRAIYLGNDPAAYAELSLALARLEMTAADWRAIRAPTLVASGAHDFLWPPEIGRQVADLIPGARFVTMEDAGHFPHLQAPETLIGLARGFFRE